MGPIACLLSAVFFGVMAIFAKLAFGDGVDLQTLLLIRFGIAGGLLLVVTQATGRLRMMSKRSLVVGVLMGAAGYAPQAGLYFAALERVDASQVALLFSIYPLLVMVAAVLTRRDRASRKRGVALLVALAGVGLVLGGASIGSFDLVGSMCALGSAVLYTVYILVGDRLTGVDPFAVAALVCCGAFVSYASWATVNGGPNMSFAATAWLWLLLIALISTVGAMALFFAGLVRVGPTVASVLSITEPVVTVIGAAWAFGESLTPQQILGGVMVLGSVAIVQWPTPERVEVPPVARRHPAEENARPRAINVQEVATCAQ